MTEPQFAPASENYLPTPDFEFSVTQKEDDFARFVAIGTLPTEALALASIITPEEESTTANPTLYRLAANLKKSRGVQERINHYYALHKASMETTVQRIEQELASMAFSDFALLYHPDGTPITNPHDLPRYLRAAVKEWSLKSDGTYVFKMHDKTKAVQMISDLGGHFNAAKEAAAPKVTINLGGEPSHQREIDVTPSPTTPSTATDQIPECLE
jgi:hypothetical protein